MQIGLNVYDKIQEITCFSGDLKLSSQTPSGIMYPTFTVGENSVETLESNSL